MLMGRKPNQHEVDHLVKRRAGLVGGLGDHLRMEEADHRRAGAERRKRDVLHLEFRRVLGFKKISSLPTFEIPSDAENLKDKTERKDTRIKNLSLRYNMWSYMVYEIKVLREYFAISYYKIKGWI